MRRTALIWWLAVAASACMTGCDTSSREACDDPEYTGPANVTVWVDDSQWRGSTLSVSAPCSNPKCDEPACHVWSVDVLWSTGAQCELTFSRKDGATCHKILVLPYTTTDCRSGPAYQFDTMPGDDCSAVDGG